MDIFRAFPRAINRTDWEIGKIDYSTAIGNQFLTNGTFDAIIDESAGGAENQSPSSANFTTDILVYMRPTQMPTATAGELVANYAVKNSITGQLYEITSAGVGRNQNTGKIEHIELILTPTTVALA